MTLQKAIDLLSPMEAEMRVFPEDVEAIQTILQHLETLKRDKDRLDWMERQTWIDFNSVGVMGLDASSLAEPCTGASYRDAIDSAMAPVPKQKGES